ncbi:MAG: DUF4336 domain-containing protein [Rhodobacteraceae bacterium]|nr:DUF4336 domain-containing protein [Paracoccaceae bacterium]MBR9822120.1 DUF4336 domain-containing protein [Paracoccaceae bacterium]
MIPFGPELWLQDGPAVTGAGGFRFPTRMAVVRLPDGAGLWIWSPVALTDALRDDLAALGEVRALVAPNSLHHSFLADWARAFPEATVHAAPGLSAETAGTPLHATLGDTAPPAWHGALEQVLVPGNRITTEVIFFHRPSATVLVTDLVQQIPGDWYRGWRALVARLDRMSGPAPAVPRKFRLAMRDRTAARAAIGRVLDWPARQLVMAHGPALSQGGGEALRDAFRWLAQAPGRHAKGGPSGPPS